MLHRFGQDTRFALVLKSEALAVDADNDRVVQDPVEHRHSEHGVAGESGDLNQTLRRLAGSSFVQLD